MAENESRQGQPRPYLRTAAISAGVILFALAFFMAGFGVHALLEEDEDSDSGAKATNVMLSTAAEDDPFWGPQNAAVTLEVFSDFQCPYCAQLATETLPKLRETYGNRLRFIYRYFPLTSIHQYAQKAAEAAQCAHDQGRFWEYHDLLFANQKALTVSDLKRYAEQVGLDSAKFDKCLDSGQNAWEVLLDQLDGSQAGVNGTPTFRINGAKGVLLPAGLTFEQFQMILDRALAAE